ncbi:MAG: long-chain fatty acid--CoA ligase [Azospirillaceae bacterium]
MAGGDVSSGVEAGRRPWEAHYPPGIAWDQPLDAAPVVENLRRTAERFPDRAGADFLGRCTSYARLWRDVRHFARGLQQAGFGKGTRIGLLLPNCPYYLIAFYGSLLAGCTVVNFNPLYTAREIARQAADSATEIMVTLDLKVLADKASPLLGQGAMRHIVICPMADILPWPKGLLFRLFKRRERAHLAEGGGVIGYARLVRNDGRPAPVAVADGDLAVLQYTGGTTGIPKGAMLSHGAIAANVAQSAAWFTPARYGEETTLAILPFFHVFAMTVLLNLSVRIGATIVMMPRFDLVGMLKTITARRPSYLAAVPTIFAAMNNHHDIGKYDLSSLRMCITGGAPLPLDVKQRFEAMTGCVLVEGYGLTEAAPVTHANPLVGMNKTGSIGLPLPQTEIKFVDLEDRDREVAPGERGELCIRGPQLMTGYLNQPGETAETLRDGWLHTADVGYVDEDGYTFIVDRIKDLILAGGYNVYPRVVEEAVYLHPAVEECVVAGVPDPYRGETVKAFVKLREGHTLDTATLKAFLQDKLSPIEMPKQVEFRTEPLPKTLIGKLDRKALLAEEAARAAAGAADTGAARAD